MKIVEITAFGPPEVLRSRTVPDPAPQPGEVLVEVEAVEVLFLDTQLRAGWGQDFFPMRPPWVPGTGVAGRLPDGRRVVARTGDAGAYAERVVVPEAEAIEVPDDVSSDVALAALHDGVLALDNLERAALAHGERVLVTAAAGSVGHWLVPLARAAGAVVVGAAGGAAKTSAVRELGADEVLDYRADGWADRLGGPFDVVFDGSGGEVGTTAMGHVRPRGRFFGYGAASGGFAEASRDDVTVVGVEREIDDDAWRATVRRGLRHIADGVVVPRIGQRAPLEQAAEAHRRMAGRGVVGKTVLTVGQPSS